MDRHNVFDHEAYGISYHKFLIVVATKPIITIWNGISLIIHIEIK